MQPTITNSLSTFIEIARQVQKLGTLIEHHQQAAEHDEDLWLAIYYDEAADFLNMSPSEFIKCFEQISPDGSMWFRKPDLTKYLQNKKDRFIKQLEEMTTNEQASATPAGLADMDEALTGNP